MAKQWHLLFTRIQSIPMILVPNWCKFRKKIVYHLVLLMLFLGTAVLPIAAQTATSEPQSLNPSELVEQSRILYESGQFAESIDRLEDAELAFATAGSTINQAMTLINLSLAYQQLENWQAAQQAITRSFDILQANELAESLKLLIQAWLVQGQLQLAVGQTEAALNSWQQAESQAVQAGDRAAEVSSQIYQSLALQELGFYLQALRTLVSPASNRLDSPMQWLQTQPNSSIKATAFRSLGNILRVTNNSEDLSALLPPLAEGDEADYLVQSRQVLQESLRIANAIQSSREIVEAEFSLANTERLAYGQAKDAFDRVPNPAPFSQLQINLSNAMNLYEEAATSQTSSHTEIEARLSQLSLLIDAAHWLQSLSEAELTLSQREEVAPLKAEVISRLQTQLDRLPALEEQINRLPASRAAIYIKVNLAQSLIKQNILNGDGAFPNFERIEQLLEISVSQAQALHDKRAEAYALGSLARLYEELARLYKENEALSEESEALETARIHTETALKLADDLQALDIIYQWQWQLGRILEGQKNITGAIAAYQQAIKTLTTLRTDLASLNNPDVPFSFRDDVEPVYRKFIELLLPRDRSLAETLNQTIRNNQDSLLLLLENPLQGAIRAVEDLQVLELENFLRCRLQNTVSVAIDQAARQNDQETAVIYPIVLDNRLEVLLKLPNQEEPIRRTTDVSQTQVEDAVEALRKAIEEEETAQLNSEAFENLYKWFFKQDAASTIETELQRSNIKTLVFVLDSVLKNIPLPALYDGQQYLIEKPYSIAVNLGEQLLENRQFGKEFNVLAAGVSVANGVSPENLDKEALPYVEEEIKQFQSWSSSNQILLNTDFTQEKLEEEVESEMFSVIHLATHGQFSSSLRDTYILAYGQAINVQQIRTSLRRREETQVNPIELLVLSACQTAEGDKRATLGIAGISVQAGAQRTIASLFNVNDESTSKLMKVLYQKLRDRNVMTVSEALRQAQLALLNDDNENSNTKKPYFWAPFILVGNWR